VIKCVNNGKTFYFKELENVYFDKYLLHSLEVVSLHYTSMRCRSSWECRGCSRIL